MLGRTRENEKFWVALLAATACICLLVAWGGSAFCADVDSLISGMKFDGVVTNVGKLISKVAPVVVIADVVMFLISHDERNKDMYKKMAIGSGVAFVAGLLMASKGADFVTFVENLFKGVAGSK